MSSGRCIARRCSPSCRRVGRLPAAASPSSTASRPPTWRRRCRRLARAGIVESVPGRKGGYRLRGAPWTSRILDVVEAVEGRDRSFSCTEIRTARPDAGAARAVRTRRSARSPRSMYRADAAWRRELEKTTLADLIRRASDRPSRQSPRCGGELDERSDAMKIFVAGATGVLGRRAVRELVRAGHDVTAVARSERRRALLRESRCDARRSSIRSTRRVSTTRSADTTS